MPAVRWLAQHGEDLGARTPDVSERARALGLEDYFRLLGLTHWQAYTAQGNIFDPTASVARGGPGVAAALRGQCMARPAYPGPWQHVATLRRLRARVDDLVGCRGVVRPFPLDLGSVLRPTPF